VLSLIAGIVDQRLDFGTLVCVASLPAVLLLTTLVDPIPVRLDRAGRVAAFALTESLHGPRRQRARARDPLKVLGRRCGALATIHSWRRHR
jgi:hypothetical protein